MVNLVHQDHHRHLVVLIGYPMGELHHQESLVDREEGLESFVWSSMKDLEKFPCAEGNENFPGSENFQGKENENFPGKENFQGSEKGSLKFLPENKLRDCLPGNFLAM